MRHVRQRGDIGMTEIHEMPPMVEDAEYLRLLGYPRGHVMPERAQDLAQEARAWYADHGRPWFYLRRCRTERLAQETILLGGTSFRGLGLAGEVADGAGAFVVAVSAGLEVDAHAQRLWHERRPDAYFFLETYASAVVEGLLRAVRQRLGLWVRGCGMALGAGVSPGFPGFDLGQQERLLGMIRAGARGGLPGHLEALSTGMLRPKKSLLAVIGMAKGARERAGRGNCGGEAGLCERCSLTRCAYRRVTSDTEVAALGASRSFAVSSSPISLDEELT